MDRRLELEGWIARTRQTQRRLAIGLAGGAVISVGLALWRTQLGLVAFAVVGVVALCGFWITASHIADWRDKLDRLDRPLRTIGRRNQS